MLEVDTGIGVSVEGIIGGTVPCARAAGGASGGVTDDGPGAWTVGESVTAGVGEGGVDVDLEGSVEGTADRGMVDGGARVGARV